ncbi:hypothetical protein OC834_007940 [Tilletia horrida]|nr:hypothetical protein OC834_007940 [Tilletia horrida]
MDVVCFWRNDSFWRRKPAEPSSIRGKSISGPVHAVKQRVVSEQRMREHESEGEGGSSGSETADGQQKGVREKDMAGSGSGSSDEEVKRASNKLDWSLSALYGNDCTRAALTLALALLRTCHWDITLAAPHSLPSTSSSFSADLSTWTLPPVPIENDLMSTARKGKGRAATLEPAFGFGKEALDVAIRSISQLLHLQDASAQLRPLGMEARNACGLQTVCV